MIGIWRFAMKKLGKSMTDAKRMSLILECGLGYPVKIELRMGTGNQPMKQSHQQAAIEGLLRLKLAAPEHCVAIRLSLTSQGYELSYEVRSPDELRKTNISMRDVHGNWIK